MRTFSETLHHGFDLVMHLEGDPLVDERSQYQHIQVFDTIANGRVLVLDGIVQLTDRDEAAYSEMLAHPPILEHGDVRRVLIVGGGDGAVAEEVLKHDRIEHIDLVDIDAAVVEASRHHFQHVNKGAFDDPRLTYHAEDAFEFLKRVEPGTYQVAIADRPDPVGPAQSMFALEFYRLVSRAVGDQGVAVFQTGCPFFQPLELSETFKLLEQTFGHAGVYLTVVPTYTGGFMTLTCGANGMVLGTAETATLAARFHEAGIKTDYYTAAIHKAAFVLPPWIERLLPR